MWEHSPKVLEKATEGYIIDSNLKVDNIKEFFPFFPEMFNCVLMIIYINRSETMRSVYSQSFNIENPISHRYIPGDTKSTQINK